MSSVADARAVGEERLREVLTNLRSGERVGGYYPRVPLREAILDEVFVDGDQSLVITRNRYGADVLNTDRLLIADIDLPELERPPPRRRLFRRSPPAPDPTVEPPPVVEGVAAVERWASRNPSLGVTVYRTFSGLRVLVSGLPQPVSAQGEQILAELGADPIYRELCRTHATYRARLTPKPWRLPGMVAPLGHWPYVGTAEREFLRWLAEYETKSRGYAVCRRLAVYGPAPSTLEASVIRLHDDRTGVERPLPLA